jgi:hypothetical protein
MRWGKKGDNRMERHVMALIVEEVRNFEKLKDEYNYLNIVDLIAHYIEEEVITSEEELLEVVMILKVKLGISIDPDAFKQSTLINEVGL